MALFTHPGTLSINDNNGGSSYYNKLDIASISVDYEPEDDTKPGDCYVTSISVLMLSGATDDLVGTIPHTEREVRALVAALKEKITALIVKDTYCNLVELNIDTP